MAYFGGIKRDIANLANLGKGRKVVDPAELARIVSLSPIETLINAFEAVREKSHAKTFAYLGKEIQNDITSTSPTAWFQF